jgi:hypothetical protein
MGQLISSARFFLYLQILFITLASALKKSFTVTLMITITFILSSFPFVKERRALER